MIHPLQVNTYRHIIMKYLILFTVLLGLTYAAKDDVEIEERTLNITETISTISDALSNLTGVDLANKTTAIEDFLNNAGLDTSSIAAIGTAGSVGAVITALSALKTALLGFLSAPLAIANGILSLIGLVLLIVFLIEGGDFLSLVGKSSEDLYATEPLAHTTAFRSLSSYNFNDYIPSRRTIDTISKMVYKALDKYDN